MYKRIFLTRKKWLRMFRYVIWKYPNRFSRTINHKLYKFFVVEISESMIFSRSSVYFVIERFWSFPGALLIKKWLSEFARPAGSFHLKSVGRNYPLILPLNQTNSYGESSLSRNFKVLGHLNPHTPVAQNVTDDLTDPPCFESDSSIAYSNE